MSLPAEQQTDTTADAQPGEDNASSIERSDNEVAHRAAAESGATENPQGPAAA